MAKKKVKEEIQDAEFVDSKKPEELKFNILANKINEICIGEQLSDVVYANVEMILRATTSVDDPEFVDAIVIGLRNLADKLGGFVKEAKEKQNVSES